MKESLVLILVCVCLITVVGSVSKRDAEGSPRAVDDANKSDKKSSQSAETPVTKPTSASDNHTCENGSTGCSDEKDNKFNLIRKISDNKDMLLRTLYVLIGVTSIVIIYFIIRAWRVRRRKSKSRKYGIITTPGSDLEMAPLDQDMDDDEDMTVFEVNGKPRK